MIAVVGIQRTPSIAADKPLDVKGPATASDSAKAPLADNSTQPESAAKSHKSAKQEKKAEHTSKKNCRAGEEAGRADDAADATVGEPLAAGMMQLLRDEIVNGLHRRGIGHRFARFQS